jgi:hypothetical protein
MGETIGGILPLGVGVAVSPLPVLAVILMLTSARARRNGPAFLLSCVVGLTAVLVVAIAIAGSLGISRGEPSRIADAVKVTLGCSSSSSPPCAGAGGVGTGSQSRGVGG